MIDPSQFRRVAAYDLLEAAARGRIGWDHRLLHALVDEPAKSLPDLLRFALEDRPDDPAPLEEDLIAIFRHLNTPAASPYFVELVRRYPREVPDELVEAFCQFPRESSELLLELYGALECDEGAEVAFVLAALRVPDERIRGLLLKRLESEPGEAAFCLGLYGDPSVRPELERALASAATDWQRQSIQEALADLDAPAPQAESPAFDIWDLYPEQAGPASSLLTEAERLEYLACPSPDYRAAAAESWIDAELSEQARTGLLKAAREDAESEVRALAWEALGGASGEEEIRAALLGRLSDESAPLAERRGALLGLAAQAGDPPVRRRILESYEIPEVRGAALETMSRSLDRRFAPYFLPHLDDPDLELRRCAILAVGRLGMQAESGRLRKFFGDQDLREDALFAYTLATPFEISRGRARALLRKVERDASGLSPAETELVGWAVDDRLARHGLQPVFGPFEEQELEEPAPAAPVALKPGRNEPCPCGSGKKFKRCCGA